MEHNSIIKEQIMYAVIAELCGTIAWYGLYDEKTAKQIAEKVNGKVVIWS